MSKGSSNSQRQATTEEKALWDSQAEQLDSLKVIAEEQHGLALEDRAYYEEVFRDADSSEAQTAMADLQESLTGTRPAEGSLTTDTLLRDVLVGSTGEMQKATETFVAKQQEDFDAFEGELTGLSQTYVDSIKSIGTEYADQLAQTKAELGTASADILSRETGAAQAGISAAYAEARKGIEGDLARRGLAGTGVEASALLSAYGSEAQAKASATTQARLSAIGLSDQQRMQKLGISGQEYQSGMSTAGGVYQQQAGIAGQMYGAQQGISQTAYSMDLANTQQGISNLQVLSAAGQGTYVGAQNYLSQAASSYGQGAQIAGQSAAQMGQMNDAWAMNQQKMQQQAGAGLGSMAMGIAGLGTGGGSTLLGGFLSSDIRYKNDIVLVDTVKGVNFYTWKWNSVAEEYGVDGEEEYGVLAQELMGIYPEFVITDENGYYKVDYAGLYSEIGE
jgi:hypothetical protein